MSSVTPNTFGFFSSGITWSASSTCGCKWYPRVFGVKSVTVYLAVDTVCFFVDVVATDIC